MILSGSYLTVWVCSGGWDADEDAKYASYNQVQAEDLMFYDIANGYPLVMVEAMMEGRTVQELIDQVPDTGACTCCSQEFDATFVKTGVGRHPFCKIPTKP